MKKAFDRDAWQEGKQTKLDEAKAALEEGLTSLQTSDGWKSMLQGMAKLGQLSVLRYSFTNQILIQSRRRGTGHAATFKTWEANGRSVKKGEKGMPILAPVVKADDTSTKPAGALGEEKKKLVGFRAIYVFGEEQTEGEPLPSPKFPEIGNEEAFLNSVETLRDVALSIPGQPVSGIELRAREAEDRGGASGWYNQRTKAIVVLTGESSRAQEFSVLCHEVAHALLHPMGDAHGAPEREVEAESTAFVVCHALGLDTGCASFPYVATWARGEDSLKMVATSGQRIATAAAKILNALCGELPGQEDEEVPLSAAA